MPSYVPPSKRKGRKRRKSQDRTVTSQPNKEQPSEEVRWTIKSSPKTEPTAASSTEPSSSSGQSREVQGRAKSSSNIESVPAASTTEPLQPPGCEKILNNELSCEYLLNFMTGVSCWKFPATTRLDTSWRQLPAGWTTFVDNVSGREYFGNCTTGESCWEFPTASRLVQMRRRQLPAGYNCTTREASLELPTASRLVQMRRPLLPGLTLPLHWQASCGPEVDAVDFTNSRLGADSWEPSLAPITEEIPLPAFPGANLEGGYVLVIPHKRNKAVEAQLRQAALAAQDLSYDSRRQTKLFALDVAAARESLYTDMDESFDSVGFNSRRRSESFAGEASKAREGRFEGLVREGTGFCIGCHVPLTVVILGSTADPKKLLATSWVDLADQLEQCGIPHEEQHAHNFTFSSELTALTNSTLELLTHELWLLLELIPEEIRPTNHLDKIMEIKLRIGLPAQMRLRCPGVDPKLEQIGDCQVTLHMLQAIMSHPRIMPSPNRFHQKRAGVKGTLHRITGLWGLVADDVYNESPNAEITSAKELLSTVGMELGKSDADVQPLICKIVDEEWYDTAESLRDISTEEWKAMQIPGRFVHAVRRKLKMYGLGGTGDPLTGLTIRVGRPVYGACACLENSLQHCRSTLLIGQAGVGKSTILREMTRVMSDTFHKCIVVVDTTSELGGFGQVPHEALGSWDVTRLEVRERSQLFEVMLDAVQNHTAQVIVIDELRDAKEVEAARTIANQGVTLLATAHGTGLAQLVHNPTLNPLVGGIESVAIGDFMMRERNSRNKFVEQRKETPPFKCVIEIRPSGAWKIYDDIANSVDDILRSPNGDGSCSLDVDAIHAGLVEGQELPDTGSTSNSSTSNYSTSGIEVLRPGVSKVPAKILAKLRSGGAYMCCFDGSAHHTPLLPVGGGACFFHIRTDGRRNEHLSKYDQTTTLLQGTVDHAEYAGLLAGVATFAELLGEISPTPSLLMVEGDNTCIIQHVREAFESRSHHFQLQHDFRLQAVLDEVLKCLFSIEEHGVKVYLRHRPRRFNKVADQIAKRAKSQATQQLSGTFQHEVLKQVASDMGRALRNR